jgi:hypothetical protein
MPDTPQKPASRVRRRRHHKGKRGLDWNVIAIASALILTAACLGTVVWAFVARRPPQVVPRPPAAGAAARAVTPASTAVPNANKTASNLLRELGDDRALAAKLGLNAGEDPRDSKMPSNLASDPDVGNMAIVRTTLGPDEPEVVEARAVLHAYLAAPPWRGKLPHVFRAGRCESLMSEFYDKRGETEPEPRAFVGAGLIIAGDSRVVNLNFTSPSRPEPGLWASFHRSAAGKLLLDWEAWTGFGEKSWTDLKKERSTSPVLMRALAEKSDRYDHQFTDAERWLAVKLGSPDGSHSITGYCDRQSGTGIALASLIGGPSQKASGGISAAPIAVTVRVAFPVAAQSDDCVNLTSLLADRWMLLDGEF